MTDEQSMSERHEDDVFVAEADEFDDLDADLPGWPKVVGIISVVWASINILCTGWKIANVTVLSGMNRQSMKQQFSGGYPPVLSDPTTGQVVIAFVSFALTVGLLIAGITLLLRKPVARALHLFYSIGSIVAILAGVWVILDLQSQVQQWINDNPGTEFSNAGGVVLGMILVMGLGFSLLGAIWPVFCLIWFGFVKKTHEDMTGGVDIDAI